MKAKVYRAKWPTCDNIVVSAWEDSVQVGIIEIHIFKEGPRKGEAHLWNLHVDQEYRGEGCGRILLQNAIFIAKESGCNVATLDWDIKEAPKWVFDWYTRNGFEEREFGRDCAFMVKTLKEESK